MSKYSEWERRADSIGWRLSRANASKDKVRTTLISKRREYKNWRTGESVFYWSYECIGINFRPLKTHNENRQTCGHIADYGHEIVRGRRRKLITAWDDIPNDRSNSRASWKHHSKRPHQYRDRG